MQVSQLVCLGLNHHTAPVELREHFSCVTLSSESQFAWDATSLRELVILSTCNRVEFYAYLPATFEEPKTALIAQLAQQTGLAPATFAEHLYFYTGTAVVEHLCRVAAGLDSLVLGEPQILGQINQACQQAQQQKRLGPVLTLLFRTATQAGKRARNETKISSNAASVSSVALALAQQAAGDLRQQRILLIGLGEIGNLTLKLLKARGIKQLSIANRTREKAVTVAAQWGGVGYGLAELPQALAAADVVISAARSPALLVEAPLVQQVMAQRPNAPLVLVDLAVPRNLDEAVGTLPGVTLFDVDDLHNSLDEAFQARQREVPQVSAIIAEEIATWQAKFQALAVEPLVVDLRQHAEAIRQRELARALRHLGEVDAELLGHLQVFSQALVNQLLHEPTKQLKKQAGRADVVEYAGTIRTLFGLPESCEG